MKDQDQELELNSEHVQASWRRPDLGPVLSDEELIARARKHIPVAARKQRYAAVRTPEQLQDDANANWDLTRALLRQYDSLTGKLKWMKMEKLLLAGILGGAAAEGIKVIAVALLKSILGGN